MQKNKIKILILSYNGRKFLKDCLNSIHLIDYNDYSVVLIDNGSIDDSVEYVQLNHPNVEIFKNEKNLMYAGGYNRFFENDSDACYYMILNNDTIVDKNVLNGLMDGVNRYGKKNIYGPKIMYMNKKDKIWFSGGKINLNKGIIKHLNIRKSDDRLNVTDSKTDYITGCCLFFHSDIIKKLKGFDESFNMYMEDVDFCMRAKEFGFNSYFLSSPKIFHHVSGTVNGKIFKIISAYIKLSFKYTGILSVFNIPLFSLRKLFRL